MAINWKLRETILRLLTAVYAEIGEEGFKGRYGRIAQLFGPDATYDAIKSFFAKEVARGAERLKDQQPGLRGIRRPLLNGLASGSSNASRGNRANDDDRQPEYEEEEEEEVRITSVQQVQRYFSYPPRRPATVDLTTETAGSPSQPLSSSREEFPDPTVNGTSSAADQGSHQQQSANTRQKITSPSRPPGSLPGRTYQFSPRPGPSRPVIGKRPYAATIDADEVLDDGNAQRAQVQRQATATNLPFGYITRDNRYRCALCSSHFSSQQALDRHESTNRAHKNNLANAFMVSRARSRLAAVDEATDDEPREVNARPRSTQARPPTFTHINGDRSTPVTQTIRAESHQRPQHPALRPLSVSSTIDESESIQPPEVRSMLFSGPSARESMPPPPPSEPETPLPTADGTQASSRDKGKGRATTPDVSSSSNGLSGERGSASGSSSSDNASATRQLHRSLAHVQASTLHQVGAGTDNPPSRLDTREADDAEAYRAAAAQLRASIGVLGERYIEKHPEWLAQMMAAVQREAIRGVSSASAVPPSSSGGISDANLRGASTPSTATTSVLLDPTRNLFVGSRVGFGRGSVGVDTARLVNGDAVGGNGGFRAGGNMRAREVPGREWKGGKADAMVIFVD